MRASWLLWDGLSSFSKYLIPSCVRHCLDSSVDIVTIFVKMGGLYAEC